MWLMCGATGGHLEPQCPNDSTSMHWTHRVPTGLCDPCCDCPQPCGMNRQHTPAVSSETKLNKSESGCWADTVTRVLCCWLLMVPLLRLLPLVVATMDPLVLANPNWSSSVGCRLTSSPPWLVAWPRPLLPTMLSLLHPVLSRCCLESCCSSCCSCSLHNAELLCSLVAPVAVQ